MKGDKCAMDENTPVQQNTDPRQACLELMNKLLATLTIFERNVKILHWNYHDYDFFSIHKSLDDIHDTACEHIDTIAEEIRKGDFYPNAMLNQCIENSSIESISSAVLYDHVQTMSILLVNIDAIRKLADALSTLADDNKFWTIQDMANDILSDMNHHRYFVKNTTGLPVAPSND